MGPEIAIGMNQKDLLCDRKGRRAHVHPSRQEALLMRLSVDSLRRVVKRDLAIEFVPQQLTSFGGLELLRRYVRSEEHTSELQSPCNLVCRLLLEKKTCWGSRRATSPSPTTSSCRGATPRCAGRVLAASWRI